MAPDILISSSHLMLSLQFNYYRFTHYKELRPPEVFVRMRKRFVDPLPYINAFSRFVWHPFFREDRKIS